MALPARKPSDCPCPGICPKRRACILVPLVKSEVTEASCMGGHCPPPAPVKSSIDDSLDILNSLDGRRSWPCRQARTGFQRIQKIPLAKMPRRTLIPRHQGGHFTVITKSLDFLNTNARVWACQPPRSPSQLSAITQSAPPENHLLGFKVHHLRM